MWRKRIALTMKLDARRAREAIGEPQRHRGWFTGSPGRARLIVARRGLRMAQWRLRLQRSNDIVSRVTAEKLTWRCGSPFSFVKMKDVWPDRPASFLQTGSGG